MSCSIHYTCPNNADVTDPAVLVAAATLWEIKQKKREKKLQKLEKEMKMETVTVTPAPQEGKLLMQNMKKESKMTKENELLTCLY